MGPRRPSSRGESALRSVYKEIVGHSAMYGLAVILGRLASLVLLPVYTRHLAPADYGCIAILDVAAGVMAVLVGAGMARAVSRYHFEARDETERDRVWWTGLTYVAALAAALVVPAWLARDVLATATLGPEVDRGAYYYSLVLPTVWFGTLLELGNAYLRIQKWSRLFLMLSLGRLVGNVALNVYLLVGLRLGIAAILIGNLVSVAMHAAIVLGCFASSRGRYRFSRSLAARLVRFGGPLVGTSLLALIIHQADRLLLQAHLGMDQVGIYALAYAIGQGVCTLILAPFQFIWGVVIYEIAERPGKEQVYTRIFWHFTAAMMLIMLGVSLVARLILGLVAPGFEEAAELVPVVNLAYILFSLHSHFEVPALLAKRTGSTLPAAILAATLNVILNMALIPILGIAGAAWVSVLTFAIFSFVGLYCYRGIERFEYPLRRFWVVLAGMVATYVGCEALGHQLPGPTWPLALSAIAWAAWAVALFGPIAQQMLTRSARLSTAVARA